MQYILSNLVCGSIAGCGRSDFALNGKSMLGGGGSAGATETRMHAGVGRGIQFDFI